MKILKFLEFTFSRLKIAIGGYIMDSRDLPQRYPQYEIGRGCYGPLKIATFGDTAKAQIGSFCSFAPGVKILLGGEHRSDWVTTYPFDRKYFKIGSSYHSSFARGDVIIGNDVWIGEDALILSGTTIGDGVIIGARSIVRGNLSPYGVYVGSPAKLVKMRFSSNIIAELMKISWWNWADENIKKKAHLLSSNDVEEFIKDCKDTGVIL